MCLLDEARGSAKIDDVTPFIREQHARLQKEGKPALVTPREHVYPVTGAPQLAADPPP